MPQYVIVGSANINQRSMDGARDSEICMGAVQPNLQHPRKGQVGPVPRALQPLEGLHMLSHAASPECHFDHEVQIRLLPRAIGPALPSSIAWALLSKPRMSRYGGVWDGLCYRPSLGPGPYAIHPDP